MTGSRPVVDFMFLDFILDALGELINQVAKMQYMSSGRLKLPPLLRGCIGVGHSAATHHSTSGYPLFVHFPGFRVVVPASPADAKGLLKTALRSDDPVLFLEHNSLLSLKGPVPEGEHLVPFGRSREWCRRGTDVTVVAVGVMVPRAEGDGDPARRRNFRGVDRPAHAGSARHGYCTGVGGEDRAAADRGRDVRAGGVGAEIAAQVIDRGFDDLDAPIRRPQRVTYTDAVQSVAGKGGRAR